MAGESLGTMVVGVTADISPAERALTSMANMLERFERQQTSRVQTRGKTKTAGGGYFSPMSEEFAAEIQRMEEVQKRAEAQLRFREIRASERGSLEARGTEPHMAALATEFRARQQREINDLQAFAERQQRIEQKKVDDLQVFAERQEQIERDRAERAQSQLQREINDLQVFAERQEAELRRSIDDLQAFAERQEQIEANKAERLRVARQREIDDLQVFAERQEAEERRLIDQLQVYAERDEQRRRERVRRKRELLQREIDDLQVWAERQEQIERDAGQALDDNMKELGRKFRAGMFGDGAGGVAHSAEKVRFAVLNLGYGIQDIAQVMGTGGFPAALRASANNLTGLAVLFNKTAIASGGVAAALAAPEIKVLAFASAALIATDALEKYMKSQDEAAKKEAARQLEGFKPRDEVAKAGRRIEFQQQLRDAEDAAQAEALVKERIDQLQVQKGEVAENLRQQTRIKKRIEDEKFLLDMIEAAAERARAAGQMRGMRSMPAGGDLPPGAELTAGEQEILKYTNILAVRQKINDLQKELVSSEKDHAGALDKIVELTKELKKAEDDLAKKKQEQRREDAFGARIKFEEAGQQELREFDKRQEADLQYRLQFLGRRRREITEQNRNAMRPVGAAGFESAEAYESLARSRMRGDPQTDLLQKIAREEEKATKALEDIRERLDPGRMARIAVLEALD